MNIMNPLTFNIITLIISVLTFYLTSKKATEDNIIRLNQVEKNVLAEINTVQVETASIKSTVEHTVSDFERIEDLVRENTEKIQEVKERQATNEQKLEEQAKKISALESRLF